MLSFYNAINAVDRGTITGIRNTDQVLEVSTSNIRVLFFRTLEPYMRGLVAYTYLTGHLKTYTFICIEEKDYNECLWWMVSNNPNSPSEYPIEGIEVENLKKHEKLVKKFILSETPFFHRLSKEIRKDHASIKFLISCIDATWDKKQEQLKRLTLREEIESTPLLQLWRSLESSELMEEIMLEIFRENPLGLRVFFNRIVCFAEKRSYDHFAKKGLEFVFSEKPPHEWAIYVGILFKLNSIAFHNLPENVKKNRDQLIDLAKAMHEFAEGLVTKHILKNGRTEKDLEDYKDFIKSSALSMWKEISPYFKDDVLFKAEFIKAFDSVSVFGGWSLLFIRPCHELTKHLVKSHPEVVRSRVSFISLILNDLNWSNEVEELYQINPKILKEWPHGKFPCEMIREISFFKKFVEDPNFMVFIHGIHEWEKKHRYENHRYSNTCINNKYETLIKTEKSDKTAFNLSLCNRRLRIEKKTYFPKNVMYKIFGYLWLAENQEPEID